MPMPEDATVASALAIAQAYAIEADASHAIVAPSGFRYSGIAWTGAGTGRERPFGLGFRSDDVLLLAFRGTADIADLIADLHAREAPFEGAPPGQPVTLMGVAGFESVYHSMRAAVHEIVSTIGPERLHLTGHSLGAALATYLCADLLLDAHVPPPRIDLTLWAPPKPGNAPFADVLRAHRDAGQVTAKALVNVHDVVPKYPFSHHYLHPFPPTLLDFGDTFDVLGNHHLDNYLQAYRQGSAHRAPVVPTHEEEYAT